MLNVEELDICHRKQKCCCVVQQRSDGKWCMQIQMTNKHQICVMEDAVITNLIHPLYISMMHAEISIFTLASGFACRNVTDIQNLLYLYLHYISDFSFKFMKLILIQGIWMKLLASSRGEPSYLGLVIRPRHPGSDPGPGESSNGAGWLRSRDWRSRNYTSRERARGPHQTTTYSYSRTASRHTLNTASINTILFYIVIRSDLKMPVTVMILRAFTSYLKWIFKMLI